MKLHFFIVSFLAAAVARAAILHTIPSPMAQGGMVRINIEFSDRATDTFDVHLDPGIPDMKPLTLRSPGNTFDPFDPWYGDLDPTQDARRFSSRYGFLLDVANSDPLPTGTSFGLRLLSAKPGLKIHFYRGTSGPELFDEVFTPSRDYVLWNGTMWHPVFTAPANGPWQATFEVFLADESAVGNVDYATSAGEAAGYDKTEFTLHFNAVPDRLRSGPLGGTPPEPVSRVPATRGMTLLELLVAIALIGAMATLAAAGVSVAAAARDRGLCAARLRSVASGVLLFAADHGGALPCSSHSSAAFREACWMRSIGPVPRRAETGRCGGLAGLLGWAVALSARPPPRPMQLRPQRVLRAGSEIR